MGKLGQPRAQLFYSSNQRLVEAKSSSTLVPPCFELKLLGSEAVMGSSPPVPVGGDPPAAASPPRAALKVLWEPPCLFVPFYSCFFVLISELWPSIVPFSSSRRTLEGSGGVQHLLEGPRSIWV